MGIRPEKLASSLKKEISQIFIEKMRDPRIGFVTITDVRISKDLKVARVLYSILGDEKAIKNAHYGLKSAAGYIKGLVGSKMTHLRYMPEIIFEFDKSLVHASNVETLISKIHQEKKQEVEPQG